MVFNLSRFHLVPEISPLDFDEDLLHALLTEAVNRGASDFELERLMSEYGRDHRISSGREHGTAGSSWSIHRRLTLDPELTVTRNVVNAYNAKVDYEFSHLPKPAYAAFVSKARDAFKSKARDVFKSHEKELALAQFRAMRPRYYQYGYSTPFETIFSRIGPNRFLGKDVDQGVHDILAPKLADVERTLNEWSKESPGLTSQVAKEITSMLGFQPRVIKGTDKLSNHAWGLAIDINATSNPHIKDRAVIDVLLQVTGYDFGKPFVLGCGVTKEEWRMARDASARLKEWLGKYLPIVTYISSYPYFPIADVNRSSDPQRDPDTEVALKRIGILLKYHSLEELKQWREHGIQSIPLALVAAMVENGLKWGGDYEESKDLMHFELLAAKVLPPDHSPGSVQDLLTNPAAGAIKAGQKKRRASHR